MDPQRTSNERCLLNTVTKLEAEREQNLEMRRRIKELTKQLAAAEVGTRSRPLHVRV